MSKTEVNFYFILFDNVTSIDRITFFFFQKITIILFVEKKNLKINKYYMLDTSTF